MLGGLVGDVRRSRDELIAEKALIRQQLIVASRKVHRNRWDEAAGEPARSAPLGTMRKQRRDAKSTTMAISSIREETRVTPTRSRTPSAGVKEETAMRSVALDLGVKGDVFLRGFSWSSRRTTYGGRAKEPGGRARSRL